MSEFGTALENEMGSRRATAAEIAAQVGVDASLLSGFLTGKRSSCRTVTLMKLVTGISADPQVQAKLLEAYFRDQCVKKIKPWVSVNPDRVPSVESALVMEAEAADLYVVEDPVDMLAATLRRIKTARPVIEAFADIAVGIQGHHKFRVVIEGLGKFAREDLAEDSARS